MMEFDDKIASNNNSTTLFMHCTYKSLPLAQSNPIQLKDLDQLNVQSNLHCISPQIDNYSNDNEHTS